MTETSVGLPRDLDELRTLFLEMCVRAEGMLRRAVRSLLEHDARLGRSVVASDEELDRLEIAVDRTGLEILASRHPENRDLWLVARLMKAATDVERVGDLAVNIAERGVDLASEAGLEPPDSLGRMGEMAADMVREAADAFVAGDVGVAQRLRDKDRELDALNRSHFQQGLAAMAAHPNQVDRALAYTNVSKLLERVGDHAVNLGEMVVFVVQGRDVRHTDADAG